MINVEDINIILKNEYKNINLNNLDKYISFVKKHLSININEIRFIIKQTLYENYKLINKKNIAENDCITIFMSKYNANVSILKRYIKINKKNFSELISKLNSLKNKAHFYFEDIDKNVPYYIEIINYLEKTSNILL
jgi:hypothetical protein